MKKSSTHGIIVRWTLQTMVGLLPRFQPSNRHHLLTQTRHPILVVETILAPERLFLGGS
jgi:hypothetical protein